MTKEFWYDTLWRIIYTLGECLLGILGGHTLVSQIDWKFTASACFIAVLATFVKCIVVEARKKVKQSDS